MEYLIIDERMRNIEKEALKNLGFELIELNKSNNVYEEISSHVDIFISKIGQKLIVEKSKYQSLKNKMPNIEIEEGNSFVSSKYPDDIKYNVCIIGNMAIHNFKYTDSKLKSELIINNYKLIETAQGYSNCSIAVIDDNSAIVTDKGLYKILKFHGIDVMYLDYEPDIKLISNNSYSTRKGFVGGAMARVQNSIVVLGDLKKIDKDNKIRNFIENRNLNIVDFKGLDVVDYGGLIEIKI